MNESTPLKLAVIGAGPVGLALALHAAAALPDAEITLFDARPLDKDVGGDPRTLALSLGTVQLLQRLDAWRPDDAQEIAEVHVSQDAPSLLGALSSRFAEAALTIRAIDEAVPMLGAVMSYGKVVAPLQAVWIDTQARAPERLFHRFGAIVTALKNVDSPRGVEVDAGIVARFDLAVVAEAACSRRRKRASSSPASTGRRCVTTTTRRRGSARRPSRAAIVSAPAASPTSASRATARPRCCR
jgi:2-octaprenyl-6-methoxyphenol hydroxylase